MEKNIYKMLTLTHTQSARINTNSFVYKKSYTYRARYRLFYIIHTRFLRFLLLLFSFLFASLIHHSIYGVLYVYLIWFYYYYTCVVVVASFLRLLLFLLGPIVIQSCYFVCWTFLCLHCCLTTVFLSQHYRTIIIEGCIGDLNYPKCNWQRKRA